MSYRYGNPVIILLYQFVYILLFYGYFSFVFPKYAYMGYQWNPDSFKIVEGLFFTFLASFFLPGRFKQPSDLFRHILFIFPIMPMLVLYGVASGEREYCYVTILAFFVILLVSAVPLQLKKMRIIRVNTKSIIRLLFFIILLYLLIILLLGGYKYFNVNIWKVYEYREAAAQNLPTSFRYFSPLIGKILLPLLVLLSLVYRKWAVLVLSMVCSFLLFALTSHKGPLLYPYISLVIFVLFKNRYSAYLLLIGLCILFLFSSSGSFLGKSGDVAGTLFLRRACFTPAKLNMSYYEYFSGQPPLLWAGSRVSMGLLEYPYSEATSKVVGRYIYNKEVSANTGWLGTGYMQAGFTGMLLYALMIGMLLKIIDMFALDKNPAFVTAITSIPILVMAVSSDVPTVLLTHGLAILLFLLSCFQTSTIDELVRCKT